MIYLILSLFPIYGDLHSHSSLSYDVYDSLLTPDSAFFYAKTKNADFLALTEHNWKDFDNLKWENLKTIADSFYIPDSFITLYGLEVGKLNEFGHIAVYQLPEYINYPYTYNLDSLYNYIIKNNLIASFAHPNLFRAQGEDFDGFRDAKFYNSAVSLIEIMNRDDIFEKECITALEKGWNLGFIAVQDNHEGQWVTLPNEHQRIPLTGVWVEEKTRENLLQSLKRRRTFAFELFPANDTVRALFYVNDTLMGGSITSVSNNIMLKIQGKSMVPFAIVSVFLNGKVKDSFLVFQDTLNIFRSYTLPSGSHTLWVKIVQEDWDRVWLSPVRINVLSRHNAENEGQPFLFPNPAKKSENLTIVLPYEMRGEIQVFTSEGAEMLKRDFEGREIILDNLQLDSGIYLLWIKGEKQAFRLKFAVK